MKVSKLIAILLGMVFVFAGCIPSQYIKGVDADDYPDKDLPIYDDAVIFEYEEDDEEVTIKYGTEDDVDDVADFYQDYFEDEGIIPDDENVEKDEYTAEGFYEDFLFEIEAEEARGDVEERVFSTVVEVKIEFIDEDDSENFQGGNLNKQILGFWEMISVESAGTTESMEGFGFALEFMADGTMNMYMFYSNEGLDGEMSWSLAENDTLTYGDSFMVDVVTGLASIEKSGGDTILYISNDQDEETYTLKKVDKDDFLSNADGAGLDDLFDVGGDDGDSDLVVPDVQERVIFDQEGIIVTMKGFEDNTWSLDLKVEIENTTDKEVDIDLLTVVVNGYSLQNAYLIGTVEGNVKLNTEISFDPMELEMCGIGEIVDIELVFELTDYETWDTILISDIIRINTGSNYTQTYDKAGITLVNEQGVKIIYQKYVHDDEFYGPYIVLYVENNTNEIVEIGSDNEQVNGYMVSGFLYGTVAPGTSSVLMLDFFMSDLEENGIETIENIKVVLNARYSHEWNYFIETELIDMPIDQ